MRTAISARHVFCRHDVSILKPLKEEKKTTMISNKKHLPFYPPGSQEEQWQLQIIARGRVNCPKCKSVSRKTVEGLKKHMDNCSLKFFTCQHCGKQFKSSTGMKYHIMADHSNPPTVEDVRALDKPDVRDKLNKMLKQLGKVKCSNEGCTAAFRSIMGYIYHVKKCGKEQAELDKMLLGCSYCDKTYKSKSGLDYHLKSEHTPASPPQAEVVCQEASDGAKVRRASAVLANLHMRQIGKKTPKDWPKRTFQSDFVPNDKKLKYSRPSLPTVSHKLLRKWHHEVKLRRKIYCPNQGCGCNYTTLSGLKTHLGRCTMSDFEVGKYRCLICAKEFQSERGVKYHINAAHSEEWYVTKTKSSMQFLTNKPSENAKDMEYHHHHQHPFPQHQTQVPNSLLCTPVERSPGLVWQAPIEMEDANKMAEGNRREHEERQTIVLRIVAPSGGIKDGVARQSSTQRMQRRSKKEESGK
ncbi:zinc finger protein 512 isoform X2 [Stigmatopora argus]